jgi:methionine transaminase
MHLPQKHTAASTTVFTVMSALAAQHNAINLSQGFPDFPLNEHLSDLLTEAARSGYNQYSPMAGLPMLREAIAADFLTRYNVVVNADTEVTVTPGATYAIYTAFTAILERGDEVIVLEPAYDSYVPNIEMNGAKVVPVPLSAPTFNPDWNAVAAAITPKTKAIIINTPHNPTGAVWNKSDWDALADLVRNTSIFILSDEVYEQLIFDGVRHYSVLEHPELRERSFALYSFGKVYNNTGWKLGYCIAVPELTAALRRIHQFLAFCVNTPSQYAIAKFMTGVGKTAQPVGALMEQKRDYFLSLLRNTNFTVHQAARGSYFQLASYEKISDLSDMEFAEWLTIHCGVATIPVSSFYRNRTDNKLIRFCFAKKEETLARAIEKISRI